MTFPTEEQHATAVMAALTAANAVPLSLSEITRRIADPARYGALPKFYTEVTVTRRFNGDGARSGGGSGVRLVRITTRAVAETEANAREMRRRTSDGLEGSSLSVVGFDSTPVEFETEDPIAPDDGWFSGLTTWTYAV
ncbi:hypothetical protein FB382_004394 [Nocardioides ginsengisegetis]|uniref:Uncharacterized protein n=1 Tax=Nocardioides ginsengisegetis TaxID=661491 RepID=A0A7W3J494_9ACTN|nr:hypothetical protein [Nocardioides ginsengisegetis]MBA8806043.1 hypothetical protein [Nocardioides ginsengisegetis]